MDRLGSPSLQRTGLCPVLLVAVGMVSLELWSGKEPGAGGMGHAPPEEGTHMGAQGRGQVTTDSGETFPHRSGHGRSPIQ